ncbi:hypothetical protein [Streptomyces varsoviensis]|uniref:Uncharacterized protein n=1 Tax=Streptomyces varsoviensis TaxID=67373 RepID=A0ABR5J799_9ACTN|nr:hypothetical protein [Streptomyces varsoviensis]KOG89341.1 hypothetical protein ADK38_14845 [Streptomyces varsoviensis]
MSKLTLYTPSPFRIRTIDTSTNALFWHTSSTGGRVPSDARLLLDAPRSLVYRTTGSSNVDEFDVSNPKSPTVTQLRTNKGVDLMCAALAGGFGQPSHVDQRLYCGGSDGFIYTFPLDSSGKTRKTTSDPAPYEVLEAHHRPIIDLAITSDGTHAFALIQTIDGKASAVTKDLKPMPHNPQPHYFADRPQWDTIPTPRHINLTPDENHIIVTGDEQSQKCTIIDPTKTESREYSLRYPVGKGGTLHLDNYAAYFSFMGMFHNIALADGLANRGFDANTPAESNFVAAGAGHILYTKPSTTDVSGWPFLYCRLANFRGGGEVDILWSGNKWLPGDHCEDMFDGIGLLAEGG